MLGIALAGNQSRGVAAADDDDDKVEMLATPKSMRVRLSCCPGSASIRQGESMLPQPVSSVT